MQASIINLLRLLARFMANVHEPAFEKFTSTVFWRIATPSDVPFGKRLLHLIMKLAFFPNFTSNAIASDPTDVGQFPNVQTHLLWYEPFFCTSFFKLFFFL
jgi:hypothetical protein